MHSYSAGDLLIQVPHSTPRNTKGASYTAPKYNPGCSWDINGKVEILYGKALEELNSALKKVVKGCINGKRLSDKHIMSFEGRANNALEQTGRIYGIDNV